MTPDAIIAAARANLDTPFRHQGRRPGVALDCAGLIIAVAGALGIPYVDRQGYGRRPASGQLEAALADQPALVRVSSPLPGDILLLRFADDPQHLGIFTGRTIIHAFLAVRKVCEHDIDAEWAKRIVAVYRFSGVEHE